MRCSRFAQRRTQASSAAWLPLLTFSCGGSEAVIRWSIVPTKCLQLQTRCLPATAVPYRTRPLACRRNPTRALKKVPRLPVGGWCRYAACGLTTGPDMDNPITASFQWSAEELLAAQRIHMRHSPEFRKFRRVRWTIMPMRILGGGFVLFIHGLRLVTIPCPLPKSQLLHELARSTERPHDSKSSPML